MILFKVILIILAFYSCSPSESRHALKSAPAPSEAAATPTVTDK